MEKIKTGIPVILFLLSSLNVNSQIHLREIVVKKDTVMQAQQWIDANIKAGLSLHIVDSPFRVFYFYEVVNSATNALSMEFYIPSDMPKARGYYLDNKKNGEWFYWSENGLLLKKEIWDKGQLKRTTKSK